MGKAIAAAGQSAFAVPSAFHISNEPAYTDTVYLGAWPRSVFDQVGGYSEHVGVNEDYELNFRIRLNGGKVFFSPAIRSAYYGRQTLGALARQYFRYGVSKVATLRLHPSSLRPRQLIAPLFVAGLVVGPLTALIHPLFGGLYALALLVYGLLNLIFSVRVALREGWALLWRLPFVFLAIHLAWGTGFWVAILRSFGSRSRHSTSSNYPK
jgi:GT2 family glycosyltransferase